MATLAGRRPSQNLRRCGVPNCPWRLRKFSRIWSPSVFTLPRCSLTASLLHEWRCTWCRMVDKCALVTPTPLYIVGARKDMLALREYQRPSFQRHREPAPSAAATAFRSCLLAPCSGARQFCEDVPTHVPVCSPLGTQVAAGYRSDTVWTLGANRCSEEVPRETLMCRSISFCFAPV